MQYMLLIYNDERAWASLAEDERSAIVREYFALTDELREHGAYVAGAPLQPTTAARTIRVRDGEQLATDGPFTETKEQLGGYYLIDAESDDEAAAWAAKIPAARYGSIEVRPLLPVPASVS
ncbi:MAG TPA: YciI family protein, partial [Gaiellaceae bacterium]